MNFRSLFSADVSPTSALESWRSAARLVRDRWEAYLVADRSARATTFATYVDALDLEASAADVLFAIARSA